jgi:alpha-mannosidase
VEALSVTDLCFGGSYDSEGLNHYWRKTLHNQFHDILPGSSIKEVYDGTDVDYARIENYGLKTSFEKLLAIAERINTEGGVLLYNPTGFARRAITVEGGYNEMRETVPPFGWTVVKAMPAESKVRVDGLDAEDEY